MKKEEVSKIEKKYMLNCGWKVMGFDIAGYSTFETVKELLDAYLEATKNKELTVKHVGVSLEFLNAIPFADRQSIETNESLLIQKVFQDAGYDIFFLVCGRLFFK